MRQIIYLLIISSIVFSNTQANELRFLRINEHSGLNQSSIDWLIQDDIGFVWLGTEDGLARYDGNQIRVYRNDPDDVRSIPDNVITALAYGSNDRLWVGTESDGASYYDYAKNEFIRLDSDALGSGVFDFYPSMPSSNDVGIRTDTGLFSINPDLVITRLLDEERSKQVLGLFSINGLSSVILNTGQQLEFQQDERTLVERPFFSGDIKHVWQGARCPVIVQDSDNEFHCPENPNHSVYKLSQHLTAAGLDLSSLSISDLVEDGLGAFWISSYSGLIRVQDGQVSLYKNNPDDPYSLSTDKLQNLALGDYDAYGVPKKLFIGTNTKGLNILNLATQGIEYYRTTNAAAKTSSGSMFKAKNEQSCGFNESDYNTIWSLLKSSDGALWVGNFSGLAMRPAGSEQFQDYSRIGTEDNFIDVCSVWSLAEANGLMWFGTWSGLIAYSRATHQLTHYAAQDEQNSIPSDRLLSGNAIRILQYDKHRNSLWVGTNANGLNRIDLSSGAIHQYLANADDPTALPHSRIRSVFIDNQQRVWVGSGGGLSLWNETNNTFRTLTASAAKNQLSDEDVRAIYQIDNDRLWVGTGNGLNLFNIESFSVGLRLSEKNGLANSTIYSLVPDDSNQLWISTANGLSRFDLEQQTFANYYVGDGLQANEFNFNAWYKDDKGLLYFGGVRGLNVISPESLKAEAAHPQAVFTSVVAADEDGNETALARMLITPIDYDIRTEQRFLRIDYSMLSFDNRPLLQSQYRLLPDLLSWSVASPATHYAEYVSLKPGKHTFEVRSAKDDSTQAQLTFYIEPHYWETTWFKALMMLVLLSLTAMASVLFYRGRQRRLIDKRTSQHYRIVEHELRPHLYEANKQLMSLVKQQDLAAGHREQLESAVQPMLKKSINFIESLRSLIDLKDAQNSSKQLYMLEDIVDETLAFFADDQHRIMVETVADSNVLIYQNSVYLILKNLLSNAIKYSTKDDNVTLSVTVDNQDLIIECLDLGVGIEASKRKIIYEPYTRLSSELGGIKGLGIGLTIIRSIVQSYRGTIEVSDNQPRGTRFLIRLKEVVSDD